MLYGLPFIHIVLPERSRLFPDKIELNTNLQITIFNIEIDTVKCLEIYNSIFEKDSFIFCIFNYTFSFNSAEDLSGNKLHIRLNKDQVKILIYMLQIHLGKLI